MMQPTPALRRDAGVGMSGGRSRRDRGGARPRRRARRWLAAGSPSGPSAAGRSPSPTSPRSRASRWRAPGSPAPRSARASSSRRGRYPIDLVFYDNQRDAHERAIANAEDAIARKVDLYIQYHRGRGGQRRHRAEAQGRGHSGPRGQLRRCPARRSTRMDNRAAGRMAGEALAQFAAAHVARAADRRRHHRPRVGARPIACPSGCRA